MKKFSFLVALLAPFLVLAACTGGEATPTLTPSPTPTPSPPTPTPTATPGKIAFFTSRDGNPELYVMNADGSGLTRLTDNPAIDGNPSGDSAPSWSPDGSHIAFTSLRDGNPETYVVNVDGTGLTRLTDNPAADGHPAWSPAR